MKTSKEMQKLILDLCRKMKFNLSEKDAYLKLTLDQKHIPLIVQRLSETTVSVSHQFISDGGLIMADPEVIFYTLFPEWVAIEITQPASNITTLGQFGGNRKYAELTSNGTYIKTYEVADQKNLATFVKSWFNSLKADGWAEFAVNAIYKQANLDDVQPAAEDESHMVEGELIYAQLPAAPTIEDLLGE